MDMYQYRAQLVGFRADLVRLETELADLDVKREDIRKQIDHTKAIIANMASLVGEHTVEEITTLGITDAVRFVLRKAYPKGLAGSEVRDAMVKGGYDLSSYTSPLSSIYTILGRLEENGQVVRNDKEYKWNPTRFSRSGSPLKVPRLADIPERPGLGEIPTRKK